MEERCSLPMQYRQAPKHGWSGRRNAFRCTATEESDGEALGVEMVELFEAPKLLALPKIHGIYRAGALGMRVFNHTIFD